MNDKELELWKEKTKGLFNIIQWNKFWNYIDSLCNQNKSIEKIIEYCKDEINFIVYTKYDTTEDANYIAKDLLEIINGGKNE